MQAAKAQISHRSKGTIAGRNQNKPETSDTARTRLSFKDGVLKTVSPSLARDADAPLCLQMGRNSCGNRGSAQGDPALALSRGLVCPIGALLCASSWSLLTASKEKVSPFSWKKETRSHKAEITKVNGRR